MFIETINRLWNTAESTWSILVAQAPITGLTHIVLICALIAVNTVVIWYAVKFNRLVNSSDYRSRRSNSDIDSDNASDIESVLSEVSVVLTVITFVVTMVYLPSAIIALLHPEYWALQQLIDLI